MDRFLDCKNIPIKTFETRHPLKLRDQWDEDMFIKHFAQKNVCVRRVHANGTVTDHFDVFDPDMMKMYSEKEQAFATTQPALYSKAADMGPYYGTEATFFVYCEVSCMHACMHVHVHDCMYIYMQIYICIYIHIYICMCMHVHDRMHACMYAGRSPSLRL